MLLFDRNTQVVLMSRHHISGPVKGQRVVSSLFLTKINKHAFSSSWKMRVQIMDGSANN